MSNFDKLDFSHLEGETDDSADFSALDNNATGNTAEQPSVILPPPPKVTRNRNRAEGSLDEGNSTFEAAILPPSVIQEENGNNNISKSPAGSFEDSFVNGPSVTNDSSLSSSGQIVEAGGVESNIPQENADGTANTNGTASAVASSFKIHYDCSGGNVSVLDGQVTNRPDGSQYINTQGIHDQWEEQRNRPLRKKRIRLIKIFSIIACVFFFPSGIPAIYYAFRTQKEFDAGIMRGTIDRAQKFAKRSERLIILSFVLAFMFGALIAALIERPYFEDRPYHRGTLVGH